MRDLFTVVRKELAELLGNRRFFGVFILAVVLMGSVPSFVFSRDHGHVTLGNTAVGELFLVVYVLFATVIVTANTAPDMVLHERVGHTLDYLLTTRLSERVVFAAKVLVSFAVGYIAAMLALGAQLVAVGLLTGFGLHWLFLTQTGGQVVAFGLTAGISLYMAVVGTFVALRVGDQRASYMVTVFSIVLFLVPMLTGWVPFALTATWLTHATLVVGAVAVALGLVGLRAFQRHMLVLYLQE